MKSQPTIIFLAFFYLLYTLSHGVRVRVAQKSPALVDVGVVADLRTPEGQRSWASISMAIDDFYCTMGNHSTTRLVLHARDSEQDMVGAASAVLDLLKNSQVKAIIGHMTSAQTNFVINLSNKAHIPFLSMSTCSPSLSSSRSPYFLTTAMNASSQAAAIAAVIKFFGWRQVVLIYDDTACAAAIIPSFTAYHIPYHSVLPFPASNDHIATELRKLASMPTRVFVVLAPAIASRLFAAASELGLMSQGYVWIAIANDMVNSSTTMHGVLSVRPRVAKSKLHGDFNARWRAKLKREPTISELWAYDTAWALALAAEKAGLNGSPRFNTNSIDMAALGVSPEGLRLVEAIKNTRFRGVAGEFRLIDNQLRSSLSFHVVNMVGENARVVGLWTPANGISGQLETVMWPGESTSVPRGWQIPASGRKLRIGVPAKKGFNQFVNVALDSSTNMLVVTGYCIDMFDAVMRMLPYSVDYEFTPFGNGSSGENAGYYDELVYQVFLEKFDVVVGDVTILANRSNFVDFTLPFTDYGMSMIVPVKDNRNTNAWIFLKPLEADLWLGSLALFLFTGFVVWMLEHRINDEFRGPPLHQLGLMLFFSFSTAVAAHRERLLSNLSRIVVTIWVFVVLILTTSYTASLTTMLTVKQLEPAVADVNELLKNGDYVGYQNGGFIGGLLKHMKFDENKITNLSFSDFNDALSKGSENGGVAAIFDEIPYLKLFLSEHCLDYTMVGPTYRTGGFGFVFPRGSPFVPDVSMAVLKVTEGDAMVETERKWFGDPLACQAKSDNLSSTRLDFLDFEGLFLVTGVVSSLALLIFFTNFVYREWKDLRVADTARSLVNRLKEYAKHFYKDKFRCRS